MLVSFEGIQGSGKTTAAVAMAYEDGYKLGRKVIANNFLTFPYTKFSIEWFLENLVTHEMEDCVLFLDEMYQLMDSRSSQSKLNKILTYFIVQTRKRNVDLFFCTHHLDHVELRLRRAVDIRGACRSYLEKPCKKCKGAKQVDGVECDRCLGYGVTGWVIVNFLDRRIRKRYTSDVFFNGPIFGPKYWKLFDTYERIPLQQKMISGIDTLEVV